MKQLESKERFIIANITWNRDGWRNIYVDRRAGHRYAKEHPGHESLNFDFDKKGLDTEKRVFGYFKWTNPPSRLGKEAVVFFYTRNLDNHKNEIVGVYGNAHILDPPSIMKWRGFEDSQLYSTLSADKSLSLLFPVPLDANKYSGGKRLVPQAGFRYVDSHLAEMMVVDEISKLRASGLKEQEYQKLTQLYKFITGKEYEKGRSAGQNEEESDKEEQSELERQISKEVMEDPRKKQELIRELKALSPSTPIQVEYKGRSYKRDNKTIAQLKVLRDFKCQLCGNRILKRNGEFYVEAAHIRPKSQKGAETPSNILILCPNHHKEFDLGSKTIIERTDEKIVFELNHQRYEIDFNLN